MTGDPTTFAQVAGTPAAKPFATRTTESAEAGTLFRCRCGATLPASMMLDLAPEGAPGLARTDLSGADRYRCSACVRGWMLRGQLTREEWQAATVAPRQPDGGA